MKNALPDSGDGNSFVSWGAEVGSLTFDGDGHVTSGELDFNEPTGGGYYSENVSGTYTVDPQQVGTISLTGATSGADYEYQITLQGGAGVATGSQATGAQLLEGVVDDSGDVEMGSGQLVQQSGSLTQASLTGNYIFGVQGVTCLGTACTQTYTGDLIAAGVLAADGSGNFGASGEADIATAFQTNDAVGVSGTYSTVDGNGRSTASLTATGYTNGALPAGYVIYIANSSTAFLMSTDQGSTNFAAPFLFGEMNQQTGTFTNATLSGNAVVAETTEDLVNESAPDTYSDAFIALLAASGGTVSGTADVNQAGTISSGRAINYGTYSVASNGRVTLTGTTLSGAPAPVFYLSGSGTGYGVDQLNGSNIFQEPGLLFLYQQTGSGFSNSTLNGNYAFGNLPAATSNVGLDINGNLIGPGLVNGDLQVDGNGNVSGEGTAIYINGAGGSGDFNGTYAIGSNGRGTLTGSTSDPTPLLGNEVFYLTDTSMAVAMDVDTGNSSPSVQIIHQ